MAASILCWPNFWKSSKLMFLIIVAFLFMGVFHSAGFALVASLRAQRRSGRWTQREMAFQDRHGWAWRRLGVVALAAALAIAGHVVASPAHAAGKSAVLVIDANTGRVLHQSAADEPRHPASLAKMMTLYLTFELIEQGRLSYQTKIKISPNAAAAAPTKLDLAEGEEIALIDAVKALTTKRAND